MQKAGVKNNHGELGSAPVKGLLLRFAVPSVIAMVSSSLYGLVDQIFVSQTTGYIGIAAIAVSFPITTISLAAALLFGGGGAALSAIRMGEEKRDEAQKILGSSLTSLGAVSVLLTVLTLVFLRPVLIFFGASTGVLPYAQDFSYILAAGIPFAVIGPGVNNFIRNDGAPRIAMLSMLGGAVVNIILDALLVISLDFGLKGAAWATVISQGLAAVFNVLYMLKYAKVRILPRQLLPDLRLVASMAAVGLSVCATQLANTAVSVTLNNVLRHYGDMSEVGGDIAVSSLGAIQRINMLLLAVLIGISQGAQPILGYNKGAGEVKRVRETYVTAALSATVVSVLGWLIFQLCPASVVSLFGERELDFMVFTEKSLRIYLFGIFCAGFQIVSSNYFMATGQPVRAVLLSLTRQLLFLVPLLIILPIFLGLDGALYAGPTADFLSAGITEVFIIAELRRLGKE